MDLSSTMPVLPVTAGGGSGGMFGGGGDWTIFLLFALIFGWGGNGMGAFGSKGGAVAENSYISNEFNYANLSNGIRSIQSGLCDSTYALNTAITGQGELTRGSVTSSAFETQRGFYDMSAQLASCCCETQRSIDRIGYENAKNTCEIITNSNLNTRDLIEAGNANTQRIVDIMNQNVVQDLRDKNTALTLQVSQGNQTDAIVSQVLKHLPYVIGTCPVPVR